MRVHGVSTTRAWLLLAIALLLLASHGIILYFVSYRLKLLSGAVVAGLVTLVVIKHLGIAAPVIALLRRRLRR